MSIVAFVFMAVVFTLVGRMTTAFWRTAEQNDREEWIDYWARQREKPTCEVSYDWRKNQRLTRYHADAKKILSKKS